MILREMLVDDLKQVMKIETELFSPPWTKEGTERGNPGLLRASYGSG